MKQPEFKWRTTKTTIRGREAEKIDCEAFGVEWQIVILYGEPEAILWRPQGEFRIKEMSVSMDEVEHTVGKVDRAWKNEKIRNALILICEDAIRRYNWIWDGRLREPDPLRDER